MLGSIVLTLTSKRDISLYLSFEVSGFETDARLVIPGPDRRGYDY